MTTAKPSYGTATAMTITLASLASSTTAGQASTAIDNTVDLADDSIVFVKVTTGTSPSNNQQILIYAYGSTDGSLYTSGATGSNAALTPLPITALKLLDIISVSSSSNITYQGGTYSIANAFGGTMPRKWGIVVINSTGVALNATAGNHSVVYTPVQYTNA